MQTRLQNLIVSEWLFCKQLKKNKCIGSGREILRGTSEHPYHSMDSPYVEWAARGSYGSQNNCDFQKTFGQMDGLAGLRIMRQMQAHGTSSVWKFD